MLVLVLVVAVLTVGRRGYDALLGPSGGVSGIEGVHWQQIEAASDPDATLWWGQVTSSVDNEGPMVLIVPGGGGQVTEAVSRQAEAYAAAGLQVLVSCIATVEPAALPGPPTSCPRTPAAAPGSRPAALDVAQVVRAVEQEHPEVVADPSRLVVVGDSYGGAAVLQAAGLTGWRHPVVTVNGTTTWQGSIRPAVPGGDLDPADPVLLAGLAAPVVQVVGLDDPVVPPGVARAFAELAEAAGRDVPVVDVAGVDHGTAFTSAPGACIHRSVAGIVRALADGRPVEDATLCR